MDCSNLVWDGDHWQVFVNTVLNFRFSWLEGNIWTGRGNSIFSRYYNSDNVLSAYRILRISILYCCKFTPKVSGEFGPYRTSKLHV